MESRRTLYYVTSNTVATYISLVLPATCIMKCKFTKHVIISVWICSQKNSVKYVSKCKQPRSQAVLEIHYSTHTCIYLLGFFPKT